MSQTRNYLSETTVNSGAPRLLRAGIACFDHRSHITIKASHEEFDVPLFRLSAQMVVSL
jgi:hypothetical protein